MNFQEMLKTCPRSQVWNEYCGFLDLSISEYMFIQHRLLAEQLSLWRSCGLGAKLLNGASPNDYEQLRAALPLTKYDNYADILLARRADMLPAEPIIWIQTTWEGGIKPIKLAPYTRSMLNTYRHNLSALTMLSTSHGHGDFDVSVGSRVLYGGAQLPYATGLMPSLLNEDIKFTWLPDTRNTEGTSFSQRIKTGFSMGMAGGIDYFFGMGSVANYITENFSRSVGAASGHHTLSINVTIAMRYLKAKYICKRDKRPIYPGDLFKLKGFLYTGPDSRCYKDALTKAWGTAPIEIAAGTESTCIASENWEHNGMVFFPDACFYEFIPESEMLHSYSDPSYVPRTCLMDEVTAGSSYEIVLSVLHGGAFMRYRIGDVYRCVSSGSGALPRFLFADRIPGVIDIAGFTRITEHSINDIIKLSGLNISDWLARKEYDSSGRPFLHMYIELSAETQRSSVTLANILSEHMSVYFKYYDSDYSDLKKLLGIDPLKITILKHGLRHAYETASEHRIDSVNASELDIAEMLRFQDSFSATD